MLILLMSLMDFLSLTLYAFQYKDSDKLKGIVLQVIDSLEDYGFIFHLGKRVFLEVL
jgi:hypothetical protein